MTLPLETLIEVYQRSLYAVAFNICRNQQDAEDVVQDTFVQYLVVRKNFSSENHLRAWLLRVAINRAKNKRNSFFRRNIQPLDAYIDTLTFETEEDSDLFLAVMTLPENYRIVIHLFYYEDYSVREIAEILRITQGNVKVRLSRGRQILRERLKEAWDDDQSATV